MKKTVIILIICCGIIVTIFPAIYFTVELIYRMGLPIKIDADGSTAFLFMDVSGPTGQPLSTWFILLWGLIGVFIIIIGIKASKKRKNNV